MFWCLGGGGSDGSIWGSIRVGRGDCNRHDAGADDRDEAQEIDDRSLLSFNLSSTSSLSKVEDRLRDDILLVNSGEANQISFGLLLFGVLYSRNDHNRQQPIGRRLNSCQRRQQQIRHGRISGLATRSHAVCEWQ